MKTRPRCRRPNPSVGNFEIFAVLEGGFGGLSYDSKPLPIVTLAKPRVGTGYLAFMYHNGTSLHIAILNTLWKSIVLPKQCLSFAFVCTFFVSVVGQFNLPSTNAWAN
jgi:hypothetical protein